MKLNLPPQMSICEVGLRDGLQNETVHLSVAQKLELIDMATAAGLRSLEIGSFVSAKAVPAMAETDEVAKRMVRREGVEYRVLVANLAGLRRCLDAGIAKAKLTVSASEAHSLKNLGRTPGKVMQDFGECVSFAREHKIALAGAISTAFGCPYEGAVALDKVRVLIESFLALGVTELSLSDTTGVANPRQVYDYCTGLSAEYPAVQWTLHFHDTRGLGLANVLAGLQANVTHYDAAFAGLGGCPFAPGATGNIATEDLVHMADTLQIDTGVDLAKMIVLGQRVQELVGRVTDSALLRVHAARASQTAPYQQQKG